MQQLEKSGHVTRVRDPDDRRAQRIPLTEVARDAIARIREVGARGMEVALSGWSAGELHQLATLFHRMVDDFVAYAKDVDPEHEGTAEPAPTAH